MAKRSLIDQLNEAVEALLAGTDFALPRADSRLAALLRIAADLRALPREDFQARLKTDLERRGTMTSKVKPIPEGFHGATPHLCVRDAASAIEFYSKAFGATELFRLTDPSGKIGHAEVRIGKALLMLADENPEYGNRSPESLGGSPVNISLYVEDVDEVARRAVAAGAKLLIPVADQFYGDRSGRLEDPFGHVWIISTHKEDVSPEEVQKRFAAFFGR